MNRRRVSAAERRLEAYEVAYLAGGPQRVLEAALFALRDRGAVTIVGPRVRAVEEDDRLAEHPVERAVLASCPRGRSLKIVANAVRGGPDVAAIKRELVALGLVARSRHRLTPAGRRQLATARKAATLPTYLFDGPAAHPDRRLRRLVAGTSLPSGLGRTLIRMGRATDPDNDYDYTHDPDFSDTHSSSEPGGFSCGSGGGGGGGGD
ncbi:TIGR04222 domain-containing membrane protein [Streptomyces camponoticapitis]|uniref:TIGR04222 domain-containing membrane protein n=1 Tax=Streptomyces camponoticapitis TaxID=1616125 RepID=UPI0016699C40|nr:TIGR04222 domain-containing membrane protein [Streptomyces camponoticapitis]